MTSGAAVSTMADYSKRIAIVQQYIDGHLTEPLDLGTLAGVAGFSMYHFSRLFYAYAGMPVIRYVKARRLEQAAGMLAGTGESVTGIARKCGFASISSFNALFKQMFGMSPKAYREGKKRKKPAESRKIREDADGKTADTPKNSFLRRIWAMNVEIKNLPEYRIAYFRHTGSYLDTGRNWQRLLAWVGKRGLSAARPLFIGISQDDPETTEEDECRHDACVTLPAGFPETDEDGVRYTTIPAGRYGQYLFYDTIDKLAIAFRALYGEWLPQSGYELDERPPLEINLNNPAEDPERKSKCLVCIPLKN
ncbi:MAG: AraC family transcriptional regulator [Anaerolineales bacterium]|nr:AraC family transcriptional regulator [Anaerolineales bacterium]